MGFTPGTNDPFVEFMRPPPDETPAQTEARIQRELDAQRVSDRIDEELKAERAKKKREERNLVKILLLGQSESGKSTTLKNFRMRYAKSDWEREREGWRAVVQLNIVRSIITILRVVEDELNGSNENGNIADDNRSEMTVVNSGSQTASTGSQTRSGGDVASSEDDEDNQGQPVNHHDSITRPISSSQTLDGSEFTDWHRLLMIRLAPLRHIETELKRRLGAGSEPVTPISGPGETMLATPFDNPADYPALGPIRRASPEFAVRSWQEVLDTGVRSGTEAGGSGLGRRNSATPTSTPSMNSATSTIAGCKKDMQALWEDRSVRNALKRRKMRLHDSAGFFLNDLDRIADRDYVVSDNDIVRARLRTVGVQEYRVRFSHGPYDSSKNPSGWEWRIFDVGGCRTSRAAWLPYFEDVNAIIFLSPVSVFDQRLEEDPRVNRLEDSLNLWTSICASKLLAKTQLILFLNKCDLLRRKLKRGTKVAQYLPSYGDRPNEVIPVVKYFREKFKDIQKNQSPEPRSIYIYPTTVTDTEATATTLESVRDGVLRENLAQSQLI